jgi:hypothetical protein
LSAALVILFAAAGYLLIQNRNLRNDALRAASERAVLEERKRELERKLEEQRSGDAETEKELAQVREKLAQTEQQLVARADSKTANPAGVAALSLAPQTRRLMQIPTLFVSRGTESVELTLRLEPPGFRAYQAALKDPATGRVIWRSRRISASGNATAIKVSFRASLLNPQNYSLELSGISAAGVDENVGSYAFRVDKK